MRKITLILLTLLMIALAGQPVSAQVDTSRVLTFMQRYFNFISEGQYASAYGYLRTGQTMYNYVGGFENTDWIQPYFGIPQSKRGRYSRSRDSRQFPARLIDANPSSVAFSCRMKVQFTASSAIICEKWASSVNQLFSA